MPNGIRTWRSLTLELLLAILLPRVASGATVTVATSPDRTDFAPVVAALPDGGWAVAWEATGAGSLGQVWIRRFDATGAPRTPEQLVDSGILALAMRAPRLAVAPDGTILVAYRLQRYDYSGLAVRRFSADGASPTATSAALLTAGPTEIGRHDVIALPGGGWLLVYAFTPADGSAPASIRALTLDAAGAASGPATTLSPADGASRVDPALARRPDGLVVTWVRTLTGAGEPPLVPVTVARRLDALGDPLEVEQPVRLEDGTPQSDRLPAAASSGNVEGRAVWFALDEATRAVTLRTRRLLDGSPVGNMLEIRSLATWLEPSLPALAADERGRFLVTWTEPIPGDPSGRFQPGWQAFGRGANPLGPMNPLPASIAGLGSASPGVAMQPGGAWAVAWGGQTPAGQSAIYADLGALADDCVATETALCLTGGRFRVEATWNDHHGLPGFGHAVPIASDTGGFWFFGPGNVELVVKVLDACHLPEFRDFWVFAAGLTDVGVDLAVTDTVTGERWTHDHPRGVPFPPVQDTDALHVCP